MKMLKQRGLPWIALILLTLLSSCGLLTIERIEEQVPLPTPGQGLEATLQALEGKLERQDDLLEYLATQMVAIATHDSQQDDFISYLATRVPAPSPSTGSVPPTPYAEIVGGVEFEGGACCIGGIAGEELEISVSFSAIGSQAPVTEMRYKLGYTQLEQGIDSAPWVPYTDQETFTYLVPINWSGFYIRVQYRDSLGNLSPIYADDISVEGMPPTPES